MVARVPGRIQAHQRPSRQIDHETVARLQHAFGGNRLQGAVKTLHQLFAVHRRRAGHQLRRIDDVPRAARMHHHPRIGQMRQQRTGTTGMIQVHMRQDQPVDLFGRHAGTLQFGQHVRHRMIGAAIDESTAAIADDQVSRRETRPHLRRIDGVDAAPGLGDGRVEITQRRIHVAHTAGTAVHDNGLLQDHEPATSRCIDGY